MENLLQKISNAELLKLQATILAKPGEVSAQDVLDLQEIHSEFTRRDSEFFAAIQSQGRIPRSMKAGYNEN